jgi:hypothetical protein
MQRRQALPDERDGAPVAAADVQISVISRVRDRQAVALRYAIPAILVTAIALATFVISLAPGRHGVRPQATQAPAIAPASAPNSREALSELIEARQGLPARDDPDDH